MQGLCYSLRRALFCSAMLMTLTACEVVRDQPPAPVINLGTRIDSIYGGMMVQGGDTVGTIAQRYNLPVRDIVEMNGLQPPYRLSPGQRLRLPAPMEHRVGRLDTLHSVGRMYNVPLSQLVRANNLQQPYLLQVGQVLRIPSSVYRQEEESGGLPAFASGPQGASQTLSRSSVLSEPLAVPTQQVARAPQGQMPSQMPFGRGPSVPAPQIDSRASEHILRLPPTAAQPQQQQTTAPATNTVPPALTAPVLPQPVTPPPTTVTLDSRRPDFNWPLRGKIISAYGAKQGGLFNDGINIAAPKGTPVAAAADGVVAYVGNDLGSYGNLVLVRHGGGMVTAYAHLNSVSVRKDSFIRKGQALGTIGSTGSVANTQLHFEIRQGTQTFDPIRYLKG